MTQGELSEKVLALLVESGRNVSCALMEWHEGQLFAKALNTPSGPDATRAILNRSTAGNLILFHI